MACTKHISLRTISLRRTEAPGMLAGVAHRYRFHIDPDTPSAALVSLDPEEAHHAVRVVRLREGEPVELFDGQGRLLLGTIHRVRRGEVAVTVEEERRVPYPQRRLTLIQAWLNAEKSLETLIRQGTEIGISRFRFFRSRYSERKPIVREKWGRIAIEVCKQCGRAWLPVFEAADDLASTLRGIEGVLLVAAREANAVSIRQAVRGEHVSLILGPEGGLTDEELATARRHGAIVVSLGPTTYRAETAALLAASLVLNELQEFQTHAHSVF